MKLIRFGDAGNERPGVQLEDGTRLDVSSGFSTYDEAFFTQDGLLNLRNWLTRNAKTAPIVSPEIRLGSPIGRPSKIICIGLNYRDHAKESGMELPAEPIVFFKATSALTGPHDGLVIPQGSEKTDWEVELAVVIGKVARRVPLAQALSHVAGYVLHNDYSERAWQLERGGQWVKGKSADTFAPLGPWVATVDEIPNPDALHLWLSVNGEQKQKGHTSNLIFDVPFLIHYLSQFMTLLPGDVISTGTPAGVGLGFKPPHYLKTGDVVELGITSLGTQRQVARAATQDPDVAVIDSHHHFWNYTPEEFSWVTDDMAILRADFLPPQLEEAVAGTEITGVVTVQAKSSVEETNWLLELASRNALIKGVVGWVPLKSPAVEALLDQLTTYPYFKGVREILQGAPDAEFFGCADFHRGIRALTSRGIPYDLLVFQHQLKSAMRFVDAHPNQRFVLDHIAKPEIRSVLPDKWAKEIRELAQRPNVFCKFSGLVTEVRGQAWQVGLLQPYFETVLEAFGSARVMFGSDWPVCLVRTGYARWVSAVEQLAAELSDVERDAIFFNTASTAYALHA